jgi:hypothetical protein
VKAHAVRESGRTVPTLHSPIIVVVVVVIVVVPVIVCIIREEEVEVMLCREQPQGSVCVVLDFPNICHHHLCGASRRCRRNDDDGPVLRRDDRLG